MKTHSEEKPYCCTFCTKSFTYNGNLKESLENTFNIKKLSLHSLSKIFHRSWEIKGTYKNTFIVLSVQNPLYRMEISRNTCEHIWKKISMYSM